MTTKNVSLETAESLVGRYIESGGEMYVAEEGVLGLGTVILFNINKEKKLKEFIIQEYFINCWTSGHKVKTYTKGLPKKYEKILAENV